MTFSNFPLDARIMRGIEDLGFTEPTPIQNKAIPAGLAGSDVLACAVTGSGKTAAFLLPIMQRLIDAPRGTTRALVVTPTRELAAQVHEQLRGLSRHAGISSVAVFGGVDLRPQARALREGATVVVATPGRLLDHMQQGNARLSGIEVLVLDEADRMLDMGFLPDVRRILRAVPAKRQTLFFSATIPPEIAKLSREMLRSPVGIDVERPAAPAARVAQTVYPVHGDLKSSLLVELLRSRDEMESVLVFTRTKHRANRVAAFLARHRIPAARIHGNRSQSQRTQALAGFKSREYRVLVATDIAARGIDVQELSHVVNLDVPHVSEDYIHRVGRTGRAGAAGTAFTFVSPEEEPSLRAIERALGSRLPRENVGRLEAAPSERAETGGHRHRPSGHGRVRTAGRPTGGAHEPRRELAIAAGGPSRTDDRQRPAGRLGAGRRPRRR